ncbi:TonB-dependent receptor [Alkalicaulis satelles]|uniref:TonB-dependent receptor n=1 Tax=Alkalicaulis satelles TaxID=2609175 RepID=A0A5M6ZEC7_9PROT|nr:TonB-dependent receptor [Alkalicaulis satelles]KAA5802167.1 TonB-dependent receptor [Alkalicaulis satelles]
MRTLKSTLYFAGVSLAALAAGAAAAQDAPQPRQTSDVVIVTGTRTEGRTVTQSLAPVDVISASDINAHGTTELNQALAYSLPSFNFPLPAISDGTDSIRPAQLRGLAPDQTLMLVNGKRRHVSALLNLNTVGRGAAAVDLNTIPTSAIGAVEVLRDGASAQYGSDAIAGVINVRLREAREGGGVTATYGAHVTDVDLPRSSRSVRDGETLTIAGWAGFPLTENGFLTVSAEYRDRKRTNRADLDTVNNYPLIGGQPDPRELSFDRLNWNHGNGDVRDVSVMANAGVDLDNGAELYGFASYQDREARSFGFYRRAGDARNVPSIYPDGFLPEIHPDVTDWSAGGGVRGDAGGLEYDFSVVHGRNTVDFNIRNTLNRSLGDASPTEFYAGQLSFRQTVVNADFVRPVAIDGLASPLNVAFGAEYRRENYRIGAGEPDSYFGVPGLAAGSQVFPGFQPQNEVNESRDSWGGYLDLEADVNDRLTVSGAVRYENYSDFGDTFNAKLSGRFEMTESAALRGSISTGFRAPSLHQSHYTATSTVFINNVATETGTFAVDSPIARALGSQDLEPETSINYSVGLVLQHEGFVLTIDGYRIEIDDRILLSENLNQANVVALLPTGVGAARFFLNAADSVTQGVDIVANYSWDTENLGSFRATAAANFTDTELKNIQSTNVLSSLDPAPVLFSRINIGRQETGSPKNKFIFGLDWNRDNLGGLIRATRFGDVEVLAGNPALDYTIEEQWVVDIEGSVQLLENTRFAIGANNLFDSYPTQNPNFNVATGPTPFIYSPFSPAGFNGRYVYGRVSVTW